eukprot:11558505-Alexandrium_andersonii.AAC.1
MSASLVGSEMCIRDRVTTGHPNALTPGSGSGGGGCWLAAPRSTWGSPAGCLLYTSDAADDM